MDSLIHIICVHNVVAVKESKGLLYGFQQVVTQAQKIVTYICWQCISIYGVQDVSNSKILGESKE